MEKVIDCMNATTNAGYIRIVLGKIQKMETAEPKQYLMGS